VRHAFRLPLHIREAVRHHVERAVAETDPARCRQEPKYTSSLITRLEGTPYEGRDGYIRLKATDVDDRARGSAESRFGADFGIVAEVSDGSATVRKAILVQAKLGFVSELPDTERTELIRQIRNMKRVVGAPKVMEIPAFGAMRDPRIISGNKLLGGGPYQSIRLADYFVTRITTTLDGNTDSEVVEAIGHSDLRKLDVLARFEIEA